MASAVTAFSDAIFAILKADSGVLAALGGKPQVYDVVPQKNVGIVMPWVYLVPAGTKRLEDGCCRGWEIRLRIFCATSDFKRDTAWTIADAVDLALDHQSPVLDPASGFSLSDDLRMVESGDIIDPDKPRAVFVDVIGHVFRTTPLTDGD